MPLIEIHKETPFLNTLGDQVNALFPTIICGDFNTVWDRAVDRRGSASSDSGHESSMVLCSLFRNLAVFDAWRRLHPDGRSFSWTRPDGLMASRIDLFGFPLAWDHFVHLCDIVPCPFSDHDAVCLTASLPQPFAKGPGRWLFNVSLLQNPSFTAALETMCTALITLILKKGDRLEHKNWRPISLLNVDYKICTRTAAGRLLNVPCYVTMLSTPIRHAV